MLAMSFTAWTAEDRSLIVRKKSSSTERRLALVIGNNSYQDAPLKNPMNDADAMAAALKETGFEVIIRKNADRRAMFSAIKEFGQKLKKNDVGLFYYAGHGIQVESLNYLLPVDLRNSDLQDADDLRRDALPLNELMERMRDAGTNNIVILDACRDNPFLAKLSRSSSRGLAKVVTPASTSILYSTDPGNTASDGASGDNGIFTKHLVGTIRKEGLELVDVMREVSLAVNRDTSGVQRPVFDGVLSSKFYFNPLEAPLPPVTIPTVPATTVTPVSDLRFWESAEKANTLSAYRAYLKKFPSGDFADIALDKIQQFEADKTRATEASKADLERKTLEVAEKERLIKERLEQDRRLKELEAKLVQTEERSKQIGNKFLKSIEVKKGIETNKCKEYSDDPLIYTDPQTCLMWPRNGNLADKKLDLNDARKWAKKLTYGGYSDWRVPTVDELETFIKQGGRRPSEWLNSSGFNNAKDQYYLTSSKRMWTIVIDLYSGSINDRIAQPSSSYVWPVRGGE